MKELDNLKILSLHICNESQSYRSKILQANVLLVLCSFYRFQRWKILFRNFSNQFRDKEKVHRLINSNKGSYFEAHRIPGRLNILDFLGCKFHFFLSILNFRVRVKQQLIYARARAEYKMINIELKEKAYILGKFLSLGKLQNHDSAKGA